MDEQEMTSWGEKISNRVEALPKDRRMMLARYMDILSRCMAAEDGCRAVIIMETEDTIALGAVNADMAESLGMVSFAFEQMTDAVMEGRPPKGMMN
jgi:predicted aconitase with swiveling domain